MYEHKPTTYISTFTPEYKRNKNEYCLACHRKIVSFVLYQYKFLFNFVMDYCCIVCPHVLIGCRARLSCAYMNLLNLTCLFDSFQHVSLSSPLSICLSISLSFCSSLPPIISFFSAQTWIYQDVSFCWSIYQLSYLFSIIFSTSNINFRDRSYECELVTLFQIPVCHLQPWILRGTGHSVVGPCANGHV